MIFFSFCVDVMEPSARPHSYQIQQSRVIQNGNSDWRRSSESTYDLSPTNHGKWLLFKRSSIYVYYSLKYLQNLFHVCIEPPPLPTTAPPLRNVHNAKEAWQNDYRHNSS